MSAPLTVVIEGDGAEAERDLSDAALAVLGAVVDFWDERGYAPSFAEVMAWSGLGSLSHVHWCVRRLAAAGLLTVVPNTARTLYQTEAGRWAVEDAALEAAA